jgi:hypothetical protein
MGPLTFDLNPQLEEDKQSPLVLLMTKWSSCDGITTLAIFPSPSSSSLLSTARSLGVLPRSSLLPAFGAMTRVPWKRQETSSNHQVFVAIKEGQYVSIDLLILMQVGFIAQLKGSLIKKQYTTATVFVDHYSKLKYIHLLTKLTSEETMDTKRAFKHFA